MSLEPSDLVIITKDRPEVLPFAIKQASEKLVLNKLILVDGSESRESDKLKALFPEVPLEIIHKPNAKIGYARQVGLSRTESRFVINFDDDIVYPRTWYRDMITFLKGEPENIASVSSRLIRAPSTSHTLFNLSMSVHNHRQPGHSGGCVLFNREKVLSVGGWNPYIHRGEDLELSQRLERAGYKWIRNGLVYALHPSSFPEIVQGMIPNGRAGVHGLYNQSLLFLTFLHIGHIIFQPLRLALRARDPSIIPHYTLIRFNQFIGFIQGVEDFRRRGSVLEGKSKYQ